MLKTLVTWSEKVCKSLGLALLLLSPFVVPERAFADDIDYPCTVCLCDPEMEGYEECLEECAIAADESCIAFAEGDEKAYKDCLEHCGKWKECELGDLIECKRWKANKQICEKLGEMERNCDSIPQKCLCKWKDKDGVTNCKCEKNEAKK